MTSHSKKRLHQGTLDEFIQIHKMSKNIKQVSIPDTLETGSSGSEVTNALYTSKNNNPTVEKDTSSITTQILEDDQLSRNSKNKRSPKLENTAQVSAPQCDFLPTEMEKSGFQTLTKGSPVNKVSVCQDNLLPINLQQSDFQTTNEDNPGAKELSKLATNFQSTVELFSTDAESSDESDSSLLSNDVDLRRSTQSEPNLPLLRPSESHTVLFNYKYVRGEIPSPHPKYFWDKWDNFHVRLPCSTQSLYPFIDDASGQEELQPRWALIQRALLNSITCSKDLEQAILTYNSQYINKWHFGILHLFFNEEFEPEEVESFFGNLLPKMIRLCLQLPNICTQPIPLLKSGMDHKITLTQQQIGSLLANAFFCTFPRRNSQKRNSEYWSYPSINFINLFTPGGRVNVKVEKLKCLINYFKAITSLEPTGVVTFHRQCVTDFPNWLDSQKQLPKLCVQSEGLIEVDGMGMLQVDFANKFVGGGVLSSGCVQEEIRFLICSELIVSRLFTERLAENEALIITGCEQFNQHSGYSETFQWEGNFEDCMPRDSWGRKMTKVVAIDALHFARGLNQFEPRQIRREMRKAFAGFLERESIQELSAVATGNWGCGAFGGDPRLKVLLQLISAAESNRDLLYLTFRDKELQKDITKMYKFLKYKEVPVGKLVQAIEAYHEHSVETKEINSLYSYLFKFCAESETETDGE